MYLLHDHEQSRRNNSIFWQTWLSDYLKVNNSKARNAASWSRNGQPLELPCVIHLHIKSLCMWVEARAICRCLITREADEAIQWRSRERLPHLGHYYQIKTAPLGGVLKALGLLTRNDEAARRRFQVQESVSSGFEFQSWGKAQLSWLLAHIHSFPQNHLL